MQIRLFTANVSCVLLPDGKVSYKQNWSIENKEHGSISFNLKVDFYFYFFNKLTIAIHFCHTLLFCKSLSHVLYFTCPPLILGHQPPVTLHSLFCHSYLGVEIFPCFLKPPWGFFMKMIHCIHCESTALWLQCSI